MLPCNALEQLLTVCSISFQTLAKEDLASVLASVCLPNDLAAYLLKKQKPKNQLILKFILQLLLMEDLFHHSCTSDAKHRKLSMSLHIS